MTPSTQPSAVLFQWIEEGMICPWWMGAARRDYRTLRTLYVLVPLNWLVAGWHWFWLALRRGKPARCPACLAMRQTLFVEQEKLERKRDELIGLIEVAREEDRKIPWPSKGVPAPLLVEQRYPMPCKVHPFTAFIDWDYCHSCYEDEHPPEPEPSTA
jgi:hypothetical protein